MSQKAEQLDTRRTHAFVLSFCQAFAVANINFIHTTAKIHYML